jgi:superfamily II DNA or RNA helicase
MDIEITHQDVHIGVSDPVHKLLEDCKGHVRSYSSLQDVMKSPTSMWSLEGPKLAASVTALGGVYWVSKDSVLNGDKWKEFALHVILEPRGVPGQWSPKIKCFYEHPSRKDIIGLPRFFGLSLFGKAQKDIRTLGHSITSKSADISLRDLQIRAVRQTMAQLEDWGGAFIIADCGFGKTRIGISLATELKRKTLILCNREVLMLQWASVVTELQPDWKVSWLQGTDSFTKKSVKCSGHSFLGPSQEADVCIGSIDTLVEGTVPKDILQTFGLVIVDEAHHLAASTLVHALPLVSSRYIVALSATPDRRDGLEHAIYWLAGPVSFVYKRLPSITGIHGSVHIHKLVVQGCGQHEKMYANGQLAFAEMTTSLSVDIRRNNYIRDAIRTILPTRSKIIVVSSLVAHCQTLRDAFADQTTAIMAGPTVEAAKAKAADTKLVFATYSMLEEGYDDPDLDTLILATPRSRVQQTVGRIERHKDGKLVPLVIDIVDPFSIYTNMWYKRFHFYKSRGFSIEDQN